MQSLHSFCGIFRYNRTKHYTHTYQKQTNTRGHTTFAQYASDVSHEPDSSEQKVDEFLFNSHYMKSTAILH